MLAGVVAAGGDRPERVFPVDCELLPGVQFAGGEFEDLRARGAVGLAVMDDVVDRQARRLRTRVAESRSELDRAAPGHSRGDDVRTVDIDRCRREAEQGKCSDIAAFDERPQAVTNERRRRVGRVAEPPACGVDDEIGIVAAEVVQVIGHRATHVLTVIPVEASRIGTVMPPRDTISGTRTAQGR